MIFGPMSPQANVYVIPLFVGSGTRIKAFEAMAMGRPVVSTTLGIEGLDVTDGEDFLRADDADAFAATNLGLVEGCVDAGPDRRGCPASGGRAVLVVAGGGSVRGDLPAGAGDEDRPCGWALNYSLCFDACHRRPDTPTACHCRSCQRMSGPPCFKTSEARWPEQSCRDDGWTSYRDK